MSSGSRRIHGVHERRAGFARGDKFVRTSYIDRTHLPCQVPHSSSRGHRMRRRFFDFSHGQVHAREHGEHHGKSTPLLMLHAAPGSALMLGPLQMRLARYSLAPDLPGMGDSDLLPIAASEPEIADYVQALLPLCDQLPAEKFDVYGTLSGVRLALEIAYLVPTRVRRVILDGVGIPKPEQLPDLLEDYAPPFAPDMIGGQFSATFLMCRDQYLFYPWYARDAEHRRPNGLPSAMALHTKTMEALKSAAGFRPLIRAAFRYDVAARLKTLTQPLLVSADAKALRPDAVLLSEPPAEPLTASDDNLVKRAAEMNAFLDAA